MIFLRSVATATCLLISAVLLDAGNRGLGWLLLVLGACQGADTVRRMLKSPEPPSAPQLRRDPDYDRRRYVPKPGGSGGNSTYVPMRAPRMYDFGACDWCRSPLAPGRAWRCGSSTNITFTAGTLTTTAMAGGGGGGSWPSPEPGERHQFCSQDHMHAWMDREGWQR